MALKARFTKALRKKADRGFTGYPVATVAYYGPNDRIATKVAVSVVLARDAKPEQLERWFSEEHDIRQSHEVNEKILQFIRTHGVKSVALFDRIIGCPHEEGVDYPDDSFCPKCPFWANRDRWTGELLPNKNDG